ncbi:hypothetical protein [Flavobacterium sp. JAS]|uniref:hypothetical protein n=1 Tax=Flavobacterium sp. JAS TaxID=2897329 RepID=UPI001E5446BE|nr:hypothetical protein [Flavobacterium sp. JAS]MCD0472507.1 hypothetical protein [Flavobacterium sp. JAS]
MGIDKSELITFILAVTLLILFIVIRYVIIRRRFNRRGVAGLQQFKNYEQAWVITLIEKILMVTSFIIIFLSLAIILIFIFF